jgi:hypothetical protein
MASLVARTVGSLLDIGVNLTGQQYELLKWRLSASAKKYYSDQETKVFYKNLMKGNLRVVDAIRKEKQKRIREMKQKLLLKIGSVICLFFMIGCQGIPKDLHEAWDVNSLKTEERTFEIKEQTIKIKGKLRPVTFDEGWIIVSEDHIKTFNENQDDLITALTKLQTTKRNFLIACGAAGVFGFLFLVTLLICIFRRKK